jgi:hypothetical protein
MPGPLLKRCAFCGCPNTSRQRFCDEHAPIARRYFDQRRGSTTERRYDGAWERVSEQRRNLEEAGRDRAGSRFFFRAIDTRSSGRHNSPKLIG